MLKHNWVRQTGHDTGHPCLVQISDRPPLPALCLPPVYLLQPGLVPAVRTVIPRCLLPNLALPRASRWAGALQSLTDTAYLPCTSNEPCRLSVSIGCELFFFFFSFSSTDIGQASIFASLGLYLDYGTPPWIRTDMSPTPSQPYTYSRLLAAC